MPFRECQPLELGAFTEHVFAGYIKDANGEPVLPPGMKALLKDDLDKGFEF